jgi:hypothetical protein
LRRRVGSSRAAEHHGDVGAQVQLQLGYANVRLSRGHILEYLKLARESVVRAAASGAEELRAVSLGELVTAEGFVGNLDECERALDEFFRSPASRSDLTSYLGFSPLEQSFTSFAASCSSTEAA